MRGSLAPFVLLTLAGSAGAHDGPPYPILVDWEVAGSLVSIWADPDVGIGTFYVYMERDGEPALLDGFQLELVTHPVDDLELVHEATAVPPREGEPFQLVAELPYDFRGMWTTRFRWTLGASSGERALDLDVTPPGFGPFDILWYLFPFLGVGFLWAKALLRRRAPRAPSLARQDGSRSRAADPIGSVEPASPDPDGPR